jgi:hypothetical protein
MLKNFDTPLILRVDGYVFHLTELENQGEGNEWPVHGAHPSRILQVEIEASHGDTICIEGHEFEVNAIGGACELVLIGDESEMGE